MRKLWAGLAVLLAVVMAAVGAASCGGGGSDVDWSNYAPEVHRRIDLAADAEDCAALQDEFDNADATDDAQRSRTGEGNADLMSYIDAQLEDAGCYG